MKELENLISASKDALRYLESLEGKREENEFLIQSIKEAEIKSESLKKEIPSDEKVIKECIEKGIFSKYNDVTANPSQILRYFKTLYLK